MKNFAKSKGKRITAALLCAVMCIMSLPLSAFAFTAEEGKTVNAYYTVKEITEILGISPSSAAKLIKANMFRSIRVGREVRIPKSDFDAWLDNESKEVNQYGINSKKKK